MELPEAAPVVVAEEEAPVVVLEPGSWWNRYVLSSSLTLQN